MEQANLVARQFAFETFRATLADVRGRPDVTEVDFRDEWLRRLQSKQDLSSNGWYDPPPNGMSVLFATDLDPKRIAFESLRNPESWPGETVADWSRGLLYAYCSPVHLASGLPGDFAVTLYFGRSEAVRTHFTNAYMATRQVLSVIGSTLDSSALFRESQAVFQAADLRNVVFSATDVTDLDLGHTLPFLPTPDGRRPRVLTQAECAHIRHARQFINDVTPWSLNASEWITIEPQLISLADPSLPQISFHYAASLSQGMRILAECDELFRDLGLI